MCRIERYFGNISTVIQYHTFYFCKPLKPRSVHSVLFDKKRQKLRKNGAILAGADEAGRGAWAGPIVAAAVIMPIDKKQAILGDIGDSKTISEAKREALFEMIKEKALCYHIRVLSPEVIDSIGVHQANLNALSLSITCLEQQPDLALIDGFAVEHFVPTEKVIKGDAVSYHIGAASILAKVARDRIMRDLDLQTDGQYGFAEHKGYGTAKHRAALEKHGVSEWHRKSYAPIKRLLNIL